MSETSNVLLRFEPGLMIWTMAVFFVLLAVLRKIAWKPLLQALDEREKQIHESLEQARKTQRETEHVVAENQRCIDKAIQKSEQIIQQAREQGEQSRRQILEEARVESRRVVDQGMRRLEAEQRTALQEVRSMAADLAIQAASRLIQASLNKQQQRKIVEKFLQEIPKKSAD